MHRALLPAVSVALASACLVVPGPVLAQQKNALGSWNWPYGFKVPDALRGQQPASDGAEVLVWTPPEATRLRSLLLIMANSDMKFYVKNLVNFTGRKIGDGDGVVYILAMHNRQVLPIAKAKAGDRIDLKVTDWNGVAERYGSIQSGSLDDTQLELSEPLYWGELDGQPTLTAGELSAVGNDGRASSPAPAVGN